MPRAPHAPPGAVLVRFVFDIDTTLASFTHCILVPGAEIADQPAAGAFVDELLAHVLPFTTGLTHSGCQLTRVEVRNWGSFVAALSYSVADNHGRYSGGQVASAASVIDWLVAAAGTGRSGRTFMPGLPDAATANHASVTEGWRSLVKDTAIAYVNGVATIDGPAGGKCALAVLHTKEGGAVLPSATVEPVVGVSASHTIGQLDRRRPYRR